MTRKIEYNANRTDKGDSMDQKNYGHPIHDLGFTVKEWGKLTPEDQARVEDSHTDPYYRCCGPEFAAWFRDGCRKGGLRDRYNER